MTDQTAAVAGAAPAKGRSPLVWVVMLLALLLVAGAGGAAWYFLMVKPKELAAETKKPEAPLPYTLAIKPFVISVPSSDGASHFIQFGPNLQLPSASAGEVVMSVLPQLQDAMRQALLGFKADDLQTADGINKMRAAMLTRVNEELLRLLGPGRIGQWTTDEKAGFVQAIYFSTLVVE